MEILGYARVSRATTARSRPGADAVDGQSLAVQARQIAGWGMMSGREITQFYEDDGVSGSIPLSERPQGAALIKRARAGDVIVAAKLDRMFRNASDALQTVDFLKREGISVIALDLGNDSITDGFSRFFMTVCAAFAEMERTRIGERISASKSDARSRGRYLGGHPPLGWARNTRGDLEAVEAEQAMLRDIRDRRADGAALRAIQAEVTATHGRRLSLRTISRVAGG